MKTVMCKKLNKECEALDYLPYPGELGKKFKRIYQKKAGSNGLIIKLC